MPFLALYNANLWVIVLLLREGELGLEAVVTSCILHSTDVRAEWPKYMISPRAAMYMISPVLFFSFFFFFFFKKKTTI